MRISVKDSAQLRAVILGTKMLERETRKQIRQHSSRVIVPEWQRTVAEQASTRLESRVLAATARVSVSDQNVTLKSAQVGRSLTGGAKPADIWHAVEFGAAQTTKTYQARSRKGRTFTVHNRHTRAHLRRRNRRGYVVHAAAAQIIPRIAALWTQTVVRGFHDAFEGR